MFKIGLSSCDKVINEELFIKYKNAGIDVMEICTAYDKYDTIDYKNISRLSAKYGIGLWSYHLPFGPFTQIDISNVDTKKYTLEYYRELIGKASDIGVDKFVVHPSGEPILPESREERMKCAKDSLAELAEIALECGAKIAVEDLPRTCLGRNSNEIAELISLHDNLGVCFDTNHLLGEDIIQFVYNLKGKIITTHISDYDFVDEKHWLPGEGDIEWGALANALKETGYTGAWLYEMGFHIPHNINRARELTCEDFVRNAKEIFEGKDITIVS